jgi:SAM-dependent methyltransferase
VTLDEAVALVEARLPLRGHARPQDVASHVGRHRDAYRHIAETVRRHVPAGGRILDFGAGLCDKTAVVQLLGYRCVAVDDFGNPAYRAPGLREQVVAFAAGVGIEVRVAGGPPWPVERESLDMVMAHDVLEHLHDSPRELLNDLLEGLRPGGCLFVTVPSAVNLRKRLAVLRGHTNLPRFDTFYWYPGPWRGHVREYTAGDLRSLAAFLGLRVLELHGAHHMLTRVPAALRPAYRAATALFPGWRDTWCLVARREAGWAPRRTVDPAALDRILDHLYH